MENVEQFIKQFKENIGAHPKKFRIPVRHVLLDTDTFRSWIENVVRIEETVEQMTDAIRKAIESSPGLNIMGQSTKIAIEKQVCKDIPFFIEKGNFVYYGRPSDGIKVAKVITEIPGKS